MARTTGTVGGRPGGPDPLMAAHANPAAPRAATAAGSPLRGAVWPARARIVPPLAQASAVMADSGTGCRGYQHRFTQQQVVLWVAGTGDPPAAAVPAAPSGRLGSRRTR